MENCWIFDIDGTLADAEHRKKWVAHKPKNWPAWYAGIAYDTPHNDIIEFNHYAFGKRIPIFICTGREENYRDVTETWLKRYDVKYYKLFMRKSKDYRSDDIIKKEMLDTIRDMGYNPVLSFDDRDRVVNMWRENGIRCLQVAPGNF
jgi:hypothetical protein